MMALFATPLARWGAVAVLLAVVGGWGFLERAGRISADLRAAAAEREAAVLQQRIRNMEVRRHEEDRVTRDPDPVGSLRRDWQRP